MFPDLIHCEYDSPIINSTNSLIVCINIPPNCSSVLTKRPLRVKTDLIVTRQQWTLSEHGLVAIAALHEKFHVIMQHPLGQSGKRLSTCDTRGEGDPCRPTEQLSLYTHFPC